ncbi:sensor histidine kinase [Sphingomonas flavalba]|uniref:sensor histidine kinase n=1 Tax=Sphingomonas flavalba TaxID=2559804 RepID=UPI00109E0BFF|nr:HAMP domain-containing sensor histidine kinase [Sphingomonas flavalba]
MTGFDAVHGRVDGDGLLIEADPPLATLNARSGGAIGRGLAIPRIAALARLARRLNIPVSRSVVVADDGQDLELWIRARPDGDGVALAIGGWHQRAAPAASLTESVEREHDFLRASADWLWETDEAMQLVAVQPGGNGVDPASLIGAPLTGLFRFVEDSDGTMPLLGALAAHRRFSGQPAEMRPTGARVRLSAVPLVDGAGRFSGYRGAAIVDDAWLTEPEPAPAVNDAFGERLDAALRQPLGRIVASAEGLSARADGPLRRDYADYAADIANAGRHLLALVDDLVDLQAIERADFQPHHDPVDLAELARNAAGLLTIKAGARRIRIDAPGPKEALAATGDYRRALQIMLNLIGNAIRHSPEDAMIWVRCEQQDEMATVTVADQGRGIDPADHQKIFEKFVRVAPEDGPGSGLGLYIARRLARAMGGDIRVDSAPGQGARFQFSLPAAR